MVKAYCLVIVRCRKDSVMDVHVYSEYKEDVRHLAACVCGSVTLFANLISVILALSITP